MKTCTKCHKTKPIADFPFRGGSRNPLAHCRDCRREYNRAYRAQRPDARKTIPEGLNITTGGVHRTGMGEAMEQIVALMAGRPSLILCEFGDVNVVPASRATPRFLALHRHAVVGTYTGDAPVSQIAADLRAHVGRVL